MSQCSVGKACAEECSGDLSSRQDLSHTDAELLRRRCEMSRVETVCQKHQDKYLKFFGLRDTACSNPLKSHGKPAKFNLSLIDLEFASSLDGVVQLIPGKKICKKCRSECRTRLEVHLESLQALQDQSAPGPSASPSTGDEHNPSSEAESVTPSHSQDFFPTPPDISLSDLNEALNKLGLTPIDIKKLKESRTYFVSELQNIQMSIKTKIEKLVDEKYSYEDSSEDMTEILSQLKQKFKETTDRAEKMRLLSVLPASWTVSQIQSEFEATEFMIRTVKSMVAEQGVLPTPSKKQGHGIDEEIIQKVLNFYEENSRMMAGKKDCISVKVEGKRVNKQKKLLLHNLSDLFVMFKADHPDVKISASKFVQLRPMECVLAGASGTHSVCVCVYHENFSLLLEECPLFKTADGSEKKQRMSVTEVLNLTMCKNPNDDCFFGECKECPGEDPVKQSLEENFDLLLQDTVTYFQWVQVDRCNLETLQKSTEEFINYFISSIPKVRKHHHIAQCQANYLRDLKTKLKPNECIVTGDFSENYTPIWQDAIQGVHWDNKTITLHPFVCYYMDGSTLNTFNYVAVSDVIAHDNAAVFSFQLKLIPQLKEKIPGLKKIFYFSDGAASQYKNKKNVYNLRLHFEDFGLEAEWHFFASCHGKGACDGIGATVKRTAAKESLRRVRQLALVTACQLYNWAKEKFKESISFDFISVGDIEEIKQKYKVRFQQAPAVNGIMLSHAIIALSPNVILMKEHSRCQTGQYVYFGPRENPAFGDMHGFVLVQHESSWRLALVKRRSAVETSSEVQVILLNPVDDSLKSFLYPEQPITCNKLASDVIAVVNVESEEQLFKIRQPDRTYANKFVKKRVQILASGSSSKRKKTSE